MNDVNPQRKIHFEIRESPQARRIIAKIQQRSKAIK